MAFLRVIGSIGCALVGLVTGLIGLMWCLFCYIPPGGYSYIGRQVRIRSMDGEMDWGKLILGILLLGVAVGAFLGAWKLWP